MERTVRTVLVDDEIGSLEALEWELKAFPFVQIDEKFDDPVKALAYLEAHQLDVLFLDIEMPVLTGFDLLKRLSRVHFHVIFTTAYDHFAIQAIKQNALDYLLKPVDEDDLKAALDKVIDSQTEDQNESQIQSLFDHLRKMDDANTITLPTLEGLEFLDQADIIHCESSGNYTNIYTLDDQRLMISKTLKEVGSLLNPSQFFRVHNSHIVNLRFIKRYIRGKGGELILKNGKIIPVSRSRKEGLMRLF